MAINILELRKSAELRKKQLAAKFTNTSSQKDERFWTLDWDKTSMIGKAVIRPIGPAMGEEEQFIEHHTHFMKRNNRFFTSICPSTSGSKDCPICKEFFSKDKDLRDKSLSRKTKYIMNILVVKDPKHPENEGKVFLYSAPKTIMDRVKDVLDSDINSEGDSIDVFDMWGGANISIITKEVGGYLNYGSSFVNSPSPIYEDVDNTALYESLYKKLYSLKEFNKSDSIEEAQKTLNDYNGIIDTSSNDMSNHIKSEHKDVFEESNSDIKESTSDVSSSIKESSEVDEEDFFNGL